MAARSSTRRRDAWETPLPCVAFYAPRERGGARTIVGQRRLARLDVADRAEDLAEAGARIDDVGADGRRRCDFPRDRRAGSAGGEAPHGKGQQEEGGARRHALIVE